MKRIGKTRAASAHLGDAYFLKAKEFFNSMKLEAEFENWNSVGLCGVHCAISASDAILAKFAKIRNVSENHNDCAQLIKTHFAHSETSAQASRLDRIIRVKNIIEYLGESFTENQAREVYKNVERYFDWVCKLMSR